MTDKILLIVPCYNESDRLNLDLFLNSDSNISFLFANDGSTDSTKELIKSYVDQNKIFLYDGVHNRGKANVIFDAYTFACKNIDLDNYDWIGYWDADLATPLFEVNNMLQLVESKPGIQAVWGSRVDRLGADIQRSLIRHYLGRIFATVVSSILKVKAYDSQCGAKMFTRKSASQAFHEEFLTNWIFDVEILLRLNQSNIIEYPLLKWTDVPGSKVNLLKDLRKVIKDIYKLWKTY